MEKRWMTIHFKDQSEMQFEFPIQDVDLTSLNDMIEKAIDNNKLILEVEDNMYIFPYDNIKYVLISPCPEMLPETTIRGAQLVP